MKYFYLTIICLVSSLIPVAIAGDFSSLTVGLWPYAASSSVAIGESSESNGSRSLAVGLWSMADGSDSLAVGDASYAGGSNSVAIGYGSYTGATEAAAIGAYGSATGHASFSMGSYTRAEGESSTSGGRWTIAYHHESFVVGQFNDPLTQISDRGSPDRPLLVVGNGVSTQNRSNALEVRANGEVHIQKIPPKGGISMGDFQ